MKKMVNLRFEILEDDRHAAHEPRQATGQADEGLYDIELWWPHRWSGPI